MKIRMLHAIAAGAVALTVTAAAAQDQKAIDKALEARQGLMQILSIETGPLFGMAKGDVAYDAEAAAAHATNLGAVTDYVPVGLFPQGSSTEEQADKTAALPAIWQDTDTFVQRWQELQQAADRVAAEAGGGQEQLAAAVADLGKTCGNCHETFRQKQ